MIILAFKCHLSLEDEIQLNVPHVEVVEAQTPMELENAIQSRIDYLYLDGYTLKDFKFAATSTNEFENGKATEFTADCFFVVMIFEHSKKSKSELKCN